MSENQNVATGPLWTVTFLAAALVAGGTSIAYDRQTAQLFGFLGAAFILVIALLHSLDGRHR